LVTRIFIVDDERMMVEAFREILRKEGIEVAGWSYDGEDAAHTYAALSPRPDIVIMDHRLPIKNGIEVMTEILKLEPSTRVLFVSADVTARRPAISAGASGFITKPFKIAQLLAAIRTMEGKGAAGNGVT